MRLSGSPLGETSRLRALPDHFAVIEDPREHWRAAHPLPEVSLLVVCGAICNKVPAALTKSAHAASPCC